jgi:tape measure domain-containing protein
MIVRELITRLGFSTDKREADKYDSMLNRLRAAADKAASKAAADETKRLSQLARAETQTARMRGAQAKAIQDAEAREARIESVRARNRNAQERFTNSQVRADRQQARMQEQHLQRLSAAKQREMEASQRRRATLQHQQERADASALKAVQARTNAQRRADQAFRAASARNAQSATLASARVGSVNARLASAQLTSAQRLANLRARHATAQTASAQRLANAQARHVTTQQAAQSRLQAQAGRDSMQRITAQRRLDQTIANGNHRREMDARRLSAFEARQAAMRRAEILRENNLRRQGRRDAQQSRIGGFVGGALGVGIGSLGIANAAGRVDEMVAVNTRLDSVFNPEESTSRNARLQDIALQTGVNKSVLGDMAYKTMRAKDSIGMKDLDQERILNIVQALGVDAATSGSSTEATNSALIQLFQGIESDRLGGQELNSVREQLPTVARTLMENLGFTDMGQLRKKAAEKGPGKGLTGKMVLEAFEKAYPDSAAKIKNIPTTFGRTMNQLSEMWNFFLLDMEKGAHLTKRFNEVMLGLAQTMMDGVNKIVVAMGGWGRASSALIAIIAGTVIPLIVKLGFTLLTWLGPLALLALPLALLFDSILEFARRYPEEWAAGMAKMKEAMGNLVDSIMYALGARLKPFANASESKPLGAIALENKGNGVVGYNGKEYKTSDAALQQAILADNPEWAKKFAETGGRIRISEGGQFKNELQTLKGGEAAMGTDWGSMLKEIAEKIQKLADWFQGDGKNKTDEVITQLKRIGDFMGTMLGLLGQQQKFVEENPNGAKAWGALAKLGDNPFNPLGVPTAVGEIGSAGMGAFQDWLRNMQGDTPRNNARYNQIAYEGGYPGRAGGPTIDKVEVNVRVEQAADEPFIKTVGDSAGRAIDNAVRGSRSNTQGIFPMGSTSMEDTARSTN